MELGCVDSLERTFLCLTTLNFEGITIIEIATGWFPIPVEEPLPPLVPYRVPTAGPVEQKKV